MDRLVRAFLASPESNIARAKTIFEYLATQVGSAQLSSLSQLAVRPWIPVQDNERAIRLTRPDEVYFQSRSETHALYANAFTFIDFGERANAFLRQCGVKAEPSHKGEHDKCDMLTDRHCSTDSSGTRAHVASGWISIQVSLYEPGV